MKQNIAYDIFIINIIENVTRHVLSRYHHHHIIINNLARFRNNHDCSLGQQFMVIYLPRPQSGIKESPQDFIYIGVHWDSGII